MKLSLSLYFTKMYFPIVSNHIFLLMSNFYGHCLLWRRSHIVVLLSEWAMVTIEYERPVNPQRSLPSFTRYSSLLAFVCFGTSSVVQRLVTISSNRFECYTEYWQVIILFFGANLSFVSQCLTEDDKHLTIISEWRVRKEKALPCRNVLERLIGPSWKFGGKFFSLEREHLTVWICKLFPVDLKI